jgi:hypothetical protein
MIELYNQSDLYIAQNDGYRIKEWAWNLEGKPKKQDMNPTMVK